MAFSLTYHRPSVISWLKSGLKSSILSFLKSWNHFHTAQMEIHKNVDDDNVNISGMRAPYFSKEEAFTEGDLIAKEPIGQFKNWFERACQIPNIIEPNAVSLATATKEGKPSVRIVLLKSFGKDGFTFFTNYSSRKGQELEQNPYAALTFYWESLRRQVRVEGKVKKVDETQSTAYFQSRPFGSQVGAYISDQSKPIASRQALIDKMTALEKQYTEPVSVLPKPTNWGGYIVIPERIEFWQGQTNRVHDRIRFRRPKPDEKIDNVMLHQGTDGWVYERLQP